MTDIFVPKQFSLMDLAAEQKLRANDALRIYRAMPNQVAFHRSMASVRLLRGGNRSGKSTSGAIEFASAATGKRIYGPDGKPLPHKFPTNRPLLMWVIGLGEDHIGDTIHRLLFQPGAFSVIRDKKTGLLRTWCPWSAEDLERESDKEQAPPLIPERFIKSIVWDGKGAKVFSHVELTNGTVIMARSSGSPVKVGDPVDCIWVDEDIVYPKYVPEWEARLSDRKGRFWWTSWPRSHNTALLTMSSRAKEQANRPNPDVSEFILRFDANPFIDADEKRKRIEGWGSYGRSELLARNEGEFALDDLLMYPNFSVEAHGTPSAEPDADDAVDAILRNRGFQPPADWTRYMVLDPGQSTAAIGFFAVATPEFGDVKVLYDELYLHNADAHDVAQAIKTKIAGYTFERFIIDYRYGRQKASGIGRTYAAIYSDPFRELGIQCVATGTNFTWGDDNVESGILAVRDWLTIRKDGRPKLRVVHKMCPKFLDEIRGYRKAITQDEAKDKPADGQKDHLMDVLRYAAAHGLPYVPVTVKFQDPEPGSTYERFKSFWQRSAPQTASASFGAGALTAR